MIEVKSRISLQSSEAVRASTIASQSVGAYNKSSAAAIVDTRVIDADFIDL